jgi:hypothetical protein
MFALDDTVMYMMVRLGIHSTGLAQKHGERTAFPSFREFLIFQR